MQFFNIVGGFLKAAEYLLRNKFWSKISIE